MADTTSRQKQPTAAFQPKYVLSADQQALLFKALNSNFSPTTDTTMATSMSNHATALPPSGSLESFETPLLDYDYDFDGDQTYDFEFPTQEQMIGKMPGASSDGDSAENHEKRSHPDDSEDDEEGGGGKRRESDDKGPKKSGRKALTSEPTSKRKAQNRAAQRAFRERKEKHLKDLETKVEDLQKASESANHENAVLRAKMERMEAELKEYKKKVTSTASSSTAPVPAYLSGSFNNPNDVNFQFEFPQFGKLPGPPVTNASASIKPAVAPSQPSPTRQRSNDGSISPLGQLVQANAQYGSFDNNSFTNNIGIIHDFNSNMSTFGPIDNAMSDFAGLFSPSILQSAAKGDPFAQIANTDSNESPDSSESARQNSTGQNTIYSSPSDSDNSNNGPTSSCGTSPEPLINSPANKADRQLAAIGEEAPGSESVQGEHSFCSRLGEACGNSNNPIPRTMSELASLPAGQIHYSSGLTPSLELNGFDWSFQNNANTSFDPQLFGGYREPQEAILAGQGLYDGSFFNEAIDMEQFGSPFNATASPQPPKKDLVTAIDEKLDADDEVVPGEQNMMTCNTMWEKIQNCPSVQNGEIDMDQLCSQLQQKAKCSGDGPVINERDFKDVIRNLFPADKPCPGTA